MIERLGEVVVTTGEEKEDDILNLKVKLYRFDKDGNQRKERDDVTVKLLKHKETKKYLFVMHQSSRFAYSLIYDFFSHD